MSNNEKDVENSSSKEENESALHMFKNFLVLDTYETDKHAGSSPVPRLGKGNEAVKHRDQKFNKKKEIDRGKKDQGKTTEKINIGERRDPEKTKRDIEKDKFYKKTEDIVKKLESGLVPPGMESEDSKIYNKTDVFVKKIESGLVPPGMEAEVLLKPNSPKSLESLSATESISPTNNIPGDNQKANDMDLHLQIKKEKKLTKEQELWKQRTPGMRPKIPIPNKPQFRMSGTPPPRATFSFKDMSKSPIRRSSVRFPRVRSPKRVQRSPGGRPRSRSPRQFWQVNSRSRSPNRFPRSKSPNRLPRSRSPRLPRSRSPRLPRRSPIRFQRHGWIRHSPTRRSRSRDRALIDRRAPHTENVSRRRSTERFLQALIRTSGIQDSTASPNVSQEFSNPDTPMMLMEFPPPMFDCGPPAMFDCGPPPMFDCGPPAMAFPPFNHPGEANPNLMPPDGCIFYPNAEDFTLPPPIFPPVPYPADFPPNAAPEAPMYFPPPIVPPPEPVGSNPAGTKTNAAQMPFYEAKLQKIPLSLIPESKLKIFPINNKNKAEKTKHIIVVSEFNYLTGTGLIMVQNIDSAYI